MKQKLYAVLLVVVGATVPGANVFAWGATGHDWVSSIAIEKLPESVPEFVRMPETVAEISAMGREPDRSKGAGRTHDAERDPGHYIDLDDDGAAMGVVPLSKLPETREEYDTLLRVKGFTQYKAGYLPYSIIDGWQQIRKDFAYWRALTMGSKTASKLEDRAWFAGNRLRREQLIIHNIGIWSNYVGDASQPLHVSVHYNGWGDYPSPLGYTTKHVRAYFEGEFVKDNLSRTAVAAKVGPYLDCKCGIEDQTKGLLLATLGQLGQLYALEKAGGFKKGDRRGIAFATSRLADGATALRNMIVDAWLNSADMSIGYPMVNVRDIESGKVRMTRELFGAD